MVYKLSKQKHPIHELAIFTVNKEHVTQIGKIRKDLRISLMAFKGFIAITNLQPVNSGGIYADIVLWETLEDANNAAKAFENGDKRFSSYMQCIEEVTFMGHFI